MILRARVIAPVSRPPFDNGAIRVLEGRILSVDRWDSRLPEAGESVVDLGPVVLFPGLINAHCHLDYTRMAGLLLPPKSFPDWISALLALKATWTDADVIQSWRAGAAMLLSSGVTTVANIESYSDLLGQLLPTTPLRIFSFLELIDLKPDPSPSDRLQAAALRIGALEDLPGIRGLSPHAPYTASSVMIRLAQNWSEKAGRVWSIHLAESEAEFDMFKHRRGPLHDWLKSMRNMADCGSRSPISLLNALGVLSPLCLAVHLNYLEDADACLLGKNQVNVVHCPRSHAFFRHRDFPLGPLRKSGVNLCLGTDSLASVTACSPSKLNLSLTAEMRCLAQQHPGLSPQSIVEMATVNAARALGQTGSLGEIRPGACADLSAWSYDGSPDDVYEFLTRDPSPVRNSMIQGRWIIPPSFGSP
ncbi:MAG TPA: amidohydrolase family protein [Candidatus Paceibacterota bacterium]|nr:amidohydrolase family protein [Verrucomicrobiota bacterium]HRY46630.1 amidohydrolase family protein [Candidatus Paceibacterota bacterium]